MVSIRRAFTDEFKAEAVRLVTVEGHSARQVAKDLGIHESLLRRWRRTAHRERSRDAEEHPFDADRVGVDVDEVSGLEAPVGGLRSPGVRVGSAADGRRRQILPAAADHDVAQDWPFNP